MNSAATLDNLVRNWKEQGRSKAEIIVLQAEAMLGWPYAWGASGQDCTPEKRRYYMNRNAIGEDEEIELRESDTVIIASPAVSGAEKEASAMENELYRDNVNVVKLD